MAVFSGYFGWATASLTFLIAALALQLALFAKLGGVMPVGRLKTR
jgi:hypothetical protein